MSHMGGIRVSEAIAQAKAELDLIHNDCMHEIDRKIEEIEKMMKSASSHDSAFAQGIYPLANEIVSEAGMFGFHEISEAARSLCDLTAGTSANPNFNVRHVQLHLDAMKSLRHPDIHDDVSIRREILKGLRHITAKFASE